MVNERTQMSDSKFLFLMAAMFLIVLAEIATIVTCFAIGRSDLAIAVLLTLTVTYFNRRYGKWLVARARAAGMIGDRDG